jgi:hypothetical protein
MIMLLAILHNLLLPLLILAKEVIPPPPSHQSPSSDNKAHNNKWVVTCKISNPNQQILLAILAEEEEIDLWNDHIPPIDNSFMALVDVEKLDNILHSFECSTFKTLRDFEIEAKGNPSLLNKSC